MAKAARKKSGPKKAKPPRKLPKAKKAKSAAKPQKKPMPKKTRAPLKRAKAAPARKKMPKARMKKPAKRAVKKPAPKGQPPKMIKQPEAHEFLSPPEIRLLLPGPKSVEKPAGPEKAAVPETKSSPPVQPVEKIEPILPEPAKAQKPAVEKEPIPAEPKKTGPEKAPQVPKTSEEKIEPILPETGERPPGAGPKIEQKPPLFQSHENHGGALAVETEPALELLPAWEDRIRLRRIIFEDGLKFNELSKSSPSFGEAFNLLVQTGRRGFRDVPGYFMICVRDRGGRIIGAMDGHLSGDVLVIGRSAAGGPKKRDLHILMYASALAGRNPKYVAFAADKKPLDFAYAGELILLGRGFGMGAISSEKIVFIRRMKKELDPLCSGQEVSLVFSSLVPFFPPLGNAGADLSGKSIVPLVMLPASPDSREHLHELRDAAESLGIRAEKMDELLEELKKRYVLGREDITPELI